MESLDTNSGPRGPRRESPDPGTIEPDRGIICRLRERTAQRKRAKLVSPHTRRILAEWLRRTARRGNDRDPIRRRNDVLLHYRAAAVRADLLEIAALLEQASDPDPACVQEVHRLLASGESPLYYRAVHVSELYATLYYIRAGLVRDHALPPARTAKQRPTARGHPDTAHGEGTRP